MTVTIDFRKTKDYLLRHKEAVAVAVVTGLVIRRQHRSIRNLNNYIVYHGIGATPTV